MPPKFPNKLAFFNFNKISFLKIMRSLYFIVTYYTDKTKKFCPFAFFTYCLFKTLLLLFMKLKMDFYLVAVLQINFFKDSHFSRCKPKWD